MGEGMAEPLTELHQRSLTSAWRQVCSKCRRVLSNGLLNHQLVVAAFIHHNNYILLTGNRPITLGESNLLFSFRGGE